MFTIKTLNAISPVGLAKLNKKPVRRQWTPTP